MYLYEPDSFAPLAQLVDDQADRSSASTAWPLQVPPDTAAANDEAADWDPRQAREAFMQRMRSQQRHLHAQMHKATQPAPPSINLPPIIEPAPKTWHLRYYHTDQIGTPRELTSESGELLWSVTYKAWGNTLREQWLPEQSLTQHDRQAQITTQHLSQHLRFQGQYFDEETGLHYNRFRYYDPDCGRFVSQDPIGLGGGQNLYQYAPNPVAWVDPGWLNSKKLDQALKGRVGDCFQAHHLIPEEVMKDPSYKTMFDKLEKMGFDPDGAGNGIHLPQIETLAKQTGLPGHWSKHDVYTSEINQKVQRLYNQFQQGKVTDMQLILGIKKIQNEARSDIVSGKVRLTSKCRLM